MEDVRGRDKIAPVLAEISERLKSEKDAARTCAIQTGSCRNLRKSLPRPPIAKCTNNCKTTRK